MVRGRSRKESAAYKNQQICSPCQQERHDRCHNKIIGLKNKTCYCALQGHYEISDE